MQIKEMAATEEEKTLVPMKEQRGTSIFAYEFENTRVNAMLFFDASGLNPHVKLIVRPSGGRKFVMEISGQNTDKPEGYFVQLLRDAEIFTFSDIFYQKFATLVSRWLKLTCLLGALARTETKDATYLKALSEVLDLSDSKDKEADCTRLLMGWLESYDEFHQL